MPAELEGRATVSDCLEHGVCGCIYGDAVQHIERLRAALQEISQPLIAMQERAKKEGYVLNGETALNIISNPEHYKKIAREALKE